MVAEAIRSQATDSISTFAIPYDALSPRFVDFAYSFSQKEKMCYSLRRISVGDGIPFFLLGVLVVVGVGLGPLPYILASFQSSMLEMEDKYE